MVFTMNTKYGLFQDAPMPKSNETRGITPNNGAMADEVVSRRKKRPQPTPKAIM